MSRVEPHAPSNGFAVFAIGKYLNLETCRKNGHAVRTPLWFAADTGPSATLYAYTLANSGKAKRIRRTDVVKIAPCDSRGRTAGPWIDARAEIVTGNEFDHGMQLINRKYRPWKQILDLSVLLFRRRQRIVLAIRPAESLEEAVWRTSAKARAGVCRCDPSRHKISRQAKQGDSRPSRNVWIRCMHEPDTPDSWRKDFVAALRLIGFAAARLPHGMPEPVLGGRAALELYSGGLWPAPQFELLTADAHRLQAELMETGFRPDECSRSEMRTLWHPALDRGVSIAFRPPVDTNVVGSQVRQHLASTCSSNITGYVAALVCDVRGRPATETVGDLCKALALDPAAMFHGEKHDAKARGWQWLYVCAALA
jgi:PPOX class probable F420-dependent enzyme